MSETVEQIIKLNKQDIPPNINDLSPGEFASVLKNVITSNLYAYYNYSQGNKNNFEDRRELINNFENLKNINKVYIKKIKNEMKILEEEEVAYKTDILFSQLDSEFKVKKRKQKFAIGLICFYTLGSFTIFKRLEMTKVWRIITYIFFLLPTIIYFRFELKKTDADIDIILLRHGINKTVQKIQYNFMNRFIEDYHFYYRKSYLP